MNTFMKLISFAAVLVFVLAVQTAVAGDLAVIVNTSNSKSSITKSELSKIFTGKKNRWSNNENIVPVDQKTSTAVAGDFLENYLRKSASEYRKLWMSKMLSGEATAPKALSSDSEVISFVKSNPGAIGYIDSENLVPDVKQLSVQ